MNSNLLVSVSPEIFSPRAPVRRSQTHNDSFYVPDATPSSLFVSLLVGSRSHFLRLFFPLLFLLLFLLFLLLLQRRQSHDLRLEYPVPLRLSPQ